MNAPERLQKCIDKRKLTVKAAAAELGVAQSAMFYWLRGASMPRAAMRETIAEWSKGTVPASAWVEQRKAG